MSIPFQELDVHSVEHELELLARQSSGFENPGALATKLSCLLSLACVEEAARPRQQSLAACAIALRDVLALAVGRISDESLRRAAAIYFFLDDEDGLDQANLGTRRAAIESMLGRNANSFRGGPEQRMRGIVVGELLRLEFEAQKGLTLPPASPGENGTSSHRAALQAIMSSLATQYRGGEDLSPLGSLLLPDRPVYYDAMIDLKLVGGPEDDTYLYDLTTTFTADMQEYLLGLVDKSALCDVILGHCPRVTDVYSFSAPEARRERAEEFAKSLDVVTMIERTSGGKTRHRPLRLLPVEQGDYGQFLDHLTDAHCDDVSLLQADFPETFPTPVRLRVRHDFALDKVGHFCYWVADRPIFVRQIMIDLSEFSPYGPDGPAPRVQPFLMTGGSDQALEAESYVKLPIENWLVRGQGVIVVW